MPEFAPAHPWAWRVWLIVCLFLSGGLWGITPSLAKIVAGGGGHPLGLTLWQGLAGGAILTVVTLLRGQTVRLSKWHCGFYVVCGITGTALPTYVLFAAAPYVPAGILAMITAMVPVMTYVAALALRIDAIVATRILGVGLGFLAVALIVSSSDGLAGQAAVGWVSLCLLIPLCYTIENIVLALRRPPYSDEISLLAGMLLMSAIMLAPIVAATGSSVSMGFPWGKVEWCIALIVVVNMVSYAFFLYTIRVAGPVFASQAGYMTVLCGVLFGIIIWQEQHPPAVWAALGLMVGGMAMVRERAVPGTP